MKQSAEQNERRLAFQDIRTSMQRGKRTREWTIHEPLKGRRMEEETDAGRKVGPTDGEKAHAVREKRAVDGDEKRTLLLRRRNCAGGAGRGGAGRGVRMSAGTTTSEYEKGSAREYEHAGRQAKGGSDQWAHCSAAQTA